MNRQLILIILFIFIIQVIVFYSVMGQENSCTQLSTMVYGSINVDGANVTITVNNEIVDWQLSSGKVYLVGLDNTNIPKNGSVPATLTASKQGYISFNETFNISCGEDLEKNITLEFIWDLDGSGITIHDYGDLMTAYKCFAGIGNCDAYYRDWSMIKQGYDCFNGN